LAKPGMQCFWTNFTYFRTQKEIFLGTLQHPEHFLDCVKIIKQKKSLIGEEGMFSESERHKPNRANATVIQN
jgi:hypothetical protein